MSHMEHRVGRFLLFDEPVECPEVPYPAPKVHARHTDTEWTVPASYEPSGTAYPTK